MTTKEKAFHLHWKFVRDIIADKDKAKQCALIAVDEIIDILYDLSDCGENIVEKRDFYEDIKQEIEKL